MKITATQLTRAVLDPQWRDRWLAGGDPSPWLPPPPGTPVVHGQQFHEIAAAFSRWLTDPANAPQATPLVEPQALFGACYDHCAQQPISAILTGGADQRVASALHLTECVRAFCGQLAHRRAVLPFFRQWRDLFLSVEEAPHPLPFTFGSAAIRVQGRWDVVRRHPQHGQEVVDYKLSRGHHLTHDLVQLAIYARLLERQHPEARFVGSLEYYLPELEVVTVEREELAQLFDGTVLPVLEELARATAPAAPSPSAPPLATPPAPPEEPSPPRERPADDPLPARIEAVFREFRLEVTVTGRQEAPQLIRYSLRPASGVKAVSLANRAEDLMVRLELPHPPVLGPGSGVVTLDLPKPRPDPVPWSRWVGDPALLAAGPLAFPIGVGVENRLLVAELADPNQCHLLVAGATGSGKSVFLQSLLATLMRRNDPGRLRLTIVDPKLLTFTALAGSPFLTQPVITGLEEATACLEEAVAEMERRYPLLQRAGVQSLHQWHARGGATLPFRLLVFDEFADLILVGGEEKKRFESLVARLAGKARAAGIHLILATQRPDRQVVTGLIKANLPFKVCLRVANGTNSQIVLDQPGGETLLGKGDLLANAGVTPVRAQALFLSDRELTEAGRGIPPLIPPP